MLFGWCDTSRGVSQVLSTSILIVWTQLGVVSLRMLSVSQHFTGLRPNLSVTRSQKAISEDLPTVCNG